MGRRINIRSNELIDGMLEDLMEASGRTKTNLIKDLIRLAHYRYKRSPKTAPHDWPKELKGYHIGYQNAIDNFLEGLGITE